MSGYASNISVNGGDGRLVGPGGVTEILWKDSSSYAGGKIYRNGSSTNTVMDWTSPTTSFFVQQYPNDPAAPQQMTIGYDESSNTFIVKIMYNDTSVKTGTISLS